MPRLNVYIQNDKLSIFYQINFKGKTSSHNTSIQQKHEMCKTNMKTHF
jgi:hypothetical protein